MRYTSIVVAVFVLQLQGLHFSSENVLLALSEELPVILLFLPVYLVFFFFFFRGGGR